MKLEFNYKNGNSGPMTLNISGDVTIRHCKEFKENLMNCLEEKSLVEISFAQADTIDLTALQLIYLLTEEFRQAEKKLSVIAPTNEETKDLIRRAGLLTLFEK